MFANFFSEHEIFIPKVEIGIEDSLATVSSSFNIPIYPNKNYEINVRQRPSIPANTKHS